MPLERPTKLDGVFVGKRVVGLRRDGRKLPRGARAPTSSLLDCRTDKGKDVSLALKSMQTEKQSARKRYRCDGRYRFASFVWGGNILEEGGLGKGA
jgi:hypothetical protein